MGTAILLIIFIGVPLWFFWAVLSPIWYRQKRWVVWYSPHDIFLRSTGTFQADWSEPMTYYMAKKYADMFNGTVYRVR